MEFLYAAHSGLRYLVLLLGVVAALYLLFGWLTRRPYGSPARILVSAFVGLLDLQVLLGIGVLLTRPYYPALVGHIVMMLAAVLAAHGLSIAARRATEAPKRYVYSLSGVVLALLLVVGGILAIGRGVFQSTLGG